MFRAMRSVLKTRGKNTIKIINYTPKKRNVSWFFRAECQELQATLQQSIIILTRQNNIFCPRAAKQEFDTARGFTNVVNGLPDPELTFNSDDALLPCKWLCQ
jgi:hypothetical protein